MGLMEKQEMIKRLAQIEAEAEAIRKNLEGPRDLEPRMGEWEISGPGSTINRLGRGTRLCQAFNPRWHKYATLEQAEWQAKAEEVRRRAQQIAAAAWKPALLPHGGGWELCFGGFPVGITFPSDTTRDDCARQLGPDIEYLNWHNSPEFKDAQK
jgi:hypothetical protein